MTASRLLEKQQSRPAQTTVKLNGAFHAPPPAALPARRAAAKAGRWRQKNAPRARAAWKGGTRPFSACNSARPPAQGFPKPAKPHGPLRQNQRPGTAPAKSGCTRWVAEKGEICRFHAFKVVLE